MSPDPNASPQAAQDKLEWQTCSIQVVKPAQQSAGEGTSVSCLGAQCLRQWESSAEEHGHNEQGHKQFAYMHAKQVAFDSWPAAGLPQDTLPEGLLPFKERLSPRFFDLRGQVIDFINEVCSIFTVPLLRPTYHQNLLRVTWQAEFFLVMALCWRLAACTKRQCVGKGRSLYCPVEVV
eukprot:4952335-Amphidinium_carterae.1